MTTVRGGAAEKAARVVEMLNEASVFIEENTRVVCPRCVSVCCINRHGRHEADDILYLRAAGLTPVLSVDGDDAGDRIPIDEAAPCVRLCREGCTLPRAERPFRCNWYFCTPLLEHMSGGPQRPYRAFIELLGRLVALRGEMLDEYRRLLAAA
jgi:hypothetical protein